MKKMRRHTQAEMFTHVKAWRKSNQSKKIYCAKQRLAYSTFKYWEKKYREQFAEQDAQEFTPGFIPVKVKPDPEMNQVRIPGQLHFLFPNGIQVMCPENVHPEVLKTLLNS